jgi:tetratricopeptide (TPR) repeat protein
MEFWKKIFGPSKSDAALEPTPTKLPLQNPTTIPHGTPQSQQPPAGKATQEFLAPLAMQEKLTVSDISPLVYQVAIEFKKTGKLLGGEVKGGVIVLRGDAKELAGLDQVYPNVNRGGVGAATFGSLLELLKKLPIADLERLMKCVDLCFEATLLAQSKPWEAAKLYQQAVELNPYDDVSRMSYGCLLGMQGNLREGIEWLEKSLKLNPGNERAKNNLEAMTAALSSKHADREPPVPASRAATDLSVYQEPSQLISIALEIIRKCVRFDGKFFSVAGAGSEGEVMGAARALARAYELQPANPALHFAWASALHLAMQYKTAEEEMKRLVEAHPQFLLARFALDGWEQWKSPFLMPEWSPTVTSGLSAIAPGLHTIVLLGVLDGIAPRATLFLRDAQGDFQNARVLNSAKIDVTTVISTITEPQVVTLNACIWDDPKNPYRVEAVDFPLRQRGHIVRRTYEYLCLQQDIDFAVIDARNRVLLNKRISMPQRMREVNQRLLKLLRESDGSKIPTDEAYTNWYDAIGKPAVKAHQGLLRPSDVRY